MIKRCKTIFFINTKNLAAKKVAFAPLYQKNAPWCRSHGALKNTIQICVFLPRILGSNRDGKRYLR